MQPVQLRMARAALDLSIEQLADKTGLAAADIARIERGADDPHGTMLTRLHATLAAAGVVLIDDDGVRYAGAPSGAAISIDDLTTDNDAGVS